MMRIVFVLGFWGILGLGMLPAQGLSIRIQSDSAWANSSIAQLAISDFTSLLDAACGCTGTREAASVQIRLRAPDPGLAATPTIFHYGDYPHQATPAHHFIWEQRDGTGIKLLELRTPSSQGLANGLYALLQEKLGFRFVHPRQSIIPRLEKWPLKGDFEFRGEPVFDKKGYHLHTMHPLELAQPLHDPDFPDGFAWLKEYVDWLARNGQNYFDFSLMEDVEDDYAAWLAHARRLVDYAHRRGILVGVDVSLHMLQQKSFQLVHFPPKSLRPLEDQAREGVRALLSAGWDVVNFEFALAEFVGGMEAMRDRLRSVVVEEIARYPHVKLVGRQHVVKPETEIGGQHGAGSLSAAQDPAMGLLVHTVMCYALLDSVVPVYELNDFQHLYDLLKESQPQRETWYYPESAYWITFDNSVPMLLLPYLGARWRDIQTVQALGVPGHLTFSSGWEWGYWLVDWSIARWTWRYSHDGVAEQTSPTQYWAQIFPPNAAPLLEKLHSRMASQLVQRNLLAHLCPNSPTDEFPAALSRQFQPRTDWHITDLRKPELADTVKALEAVIGKLNAEADSLLGWVQELRKEVAAGADFGALQAEILDGIEITALRMRHRAALYVALRARAKARTSIGTQREALLWGLEQAAEVRAQALAIVRRREAGYRYPLHWLAGRYDSFTAYDFGYLHTVHDLHFWRREEEQLRTGRSGPFFMGVFDLAKIGGVKD